MIVSLQIKKQIHSSRKFIFFLLLLYFQTSNACAHQDTLQQKRCSVEIQLFTKSFLFNESAETLSFDSDFKRTLLIYQQRLSSSFSFCLAGDTYAKNKNKPYHLTPFLKRAFLQYHNKQLSVSAGLLVLEQFKYQRKIWGLRYIDKTFQNKFGYGENRNIGVLLKHRLSSRFSYDVAFTSGYCTPIADYSDKYTLMSGQTFNTKFCALKLFNSISYHSNYEYVLSLFATKKLLKGNLGIEAARKYSDNQVVKEDKCGFSVFGIYSLANNIMCFARYDLNNETGEMSANCMIWGGLEYSFKKYLKASFYYKSKNLDTNYYGIAVFLKITEGCCFYKYN